MTMRYMILGEFIGSLYLSVVQLHLRAVQYTRLHSILWLNRCRWFEFAGGIYPTGQSGREPNQTKSESNKIKEVQ